MMHILVITPNYPNKINNRCVAFFESQVKSLLFSGQNVGVISVVSVSFKNFFSIFKSPLSFHYNILQSYVLWIPFFYRFNQYLRFFWGKFLFQKYIKIYGLPDIVHLHVYNSGRLAIWIKDNFGIPYVVTEHYSSVGRNQLTNYQNFLAKQSYQNANKCFAVSNSLASNLSEKFHVHFGVIPNVLDSEFYFLPTNENNSRYILNVANMVDIKRHDRLLRVFSRFHEYDPTFKLILIGRGPLSNKVKNYIKELNLSDVVTIIPSASRSQVADLMREASIFLLTSDYETFGVVLIESLACGTPVVAPNVGGIPDIVVNGQNGFLCEPNEDSFLKGLLSVVDSHFDHEKISRNVLNTYGSDTFSKTLLDVYRLVIESIK